MKSYANGPGLGRRILAIVLAALAGLAHPWLMTFQVMLPFAAPMLGAVMAPVTYAMGGMAAPIVLMIMAIGGSFVTMGIQLAISALPAFLLPSVVMLIGLKKNGAFSIQLRNAIAAACGGMLGSIVITNLLFGTDFIAQFMNLMREVFDGNQSYFRSMALLYSESIGEITAEEFTAAYYEILNLMEQYYTTNLYANLLGAGVTTAALGVLWANWLQARRGIATSESFAPISRWFLPTDTTVGLLLMLVAAYVITKTNFSGAIPAWYIVSKLAIIAFDIQAVASLNRGAIRKGWSVPARTAITVLFVVLMYIGQDLLFGVKVNAVFAFVGACSAFFGERGVIRITVKKNDQ